MTFNQLRDLLPDLLGQRIHLFDDNGRPINHIACRYVGQHAYVELSHTYSGINSDAADAIEAEITRQDEAAEIDDGE